MFGTIGIVLCAMAFGGLMERTGMLSTIANAIMKVATSTGRLVASTLATCIGMNVIAPDQYLSIVVPGRMNKEAYEKAGLDRKNLSRCLEDRPPLRIGDMTMKGGRGIAALPQPVHLVVHERDEG